mmetsp:Transcript_8138/g.11725  ORF Transcript_8138/g.11725 Transcript_8138/m.11725 type:complete len:636 (+) Transcript_8138:96-2003(+)
MKSLSAIIPTLVFVSFYVCNVQGLTATSFQSSAVSSAPSNSDAPTKTVLPPNGSFRSTISGELSVASMNILAPTLHSLSEPEATREQHAAIDRKERVPSSIRMAKQSGADILCLQEVEGVEHLPFLEELLLCDETREDGSISRGYDSFSWSPLHPHRAGEVVGLCVAWRSDRHTLASSHGFRRGQVVQLQEMDGGSTFCIGNVHLPARPSDIYGRLKAVSTLCRRIEDCRLHKHSSSPLDGAAFVMGDFNCDASCSPVSFLRDGYQPHGIIFERNHRHKISKNDAKKFRHGLRFLDAYGPNLRKSQASITVSLTGRGPGSMDHVLYTPGRWGKTKAASRKIISSDFAVLAGGGRRQKRRLRAESKVEARVSLEPPSMLRVDSVLATIDPDDKDRTQIIVDGLPNLGAGFPSDHLPVGVLFTPTEEEEDNTDVNMVGSGKDEDISLGDESQSNEETTPTVTKRRRGARSMAVVTRQRHNALLRALSTWLRSRGVTDVIQDSPLYQWHWVEGLEYLRKKMRAPDLCCVAPKDGVLMMIEVTVSKSPTSVRKHKEKKYHDLAPILSSAPKVKGASLSVLDAFVVVVNEEGTLPPETINTLESLALLTAANDESKQNVDEAVREIALELLRIRNHWMNQ